MTPTTHISASKDDLAETIIMPGDPLRSQMIANTFLENPVLVNNVRGVQGYTGYYNGKKITVMASGMGNPSMGIYSYELFKFYDVEEIIRVGTCGAYKEELNLYDTIVVEGSYSVSNYAKEQSNCLDSIIYSDKELSQKLIDAAKDLEINVKTGLIHCSDVFYKENNNYIELVEKYNVLGVEMETFALFSNAKVLNKKATCILTVSDNLVTKEETTSSERQNSFHTMIKVALESILK